ncbi:MAG: sensor histidine kinase, partial [Bryobacteraceae bacterium]
MTRRARLTLVSVLLAAALATAISAVYLRNQLNEHFRFALQRSEMFKTLAVDAVTRSLDRSPELSIEEALAADAELPTQLAKIMGISRSLLEIAVCDTAGRVLVSTDSTHDRGQPFPADYADFARLVNAAGTVEKIRVLTERNLRYYRLSQPLGSEDQQPALLVHVVVYPALIRVDVAQDARRAGLLSLAAVLASMIVTLVFSAYAFKPLSRVTQMLDQITRGDFVPEKAVGREDEFAPLFSKVSLLGEQIDNFERLLDELEEAVLVFGRDRNLVVASGALERFLGKRRADLLGQPLARLFPTSQPAGVLLEQILETGRPVRRWLVELNGMPKALLSADVADHRLIVRLRDPEAQRQIEGRLQTARRLAAISRLTGGLAHEVKNPLNAILMHVELAKLKLGKGESDLQPQMDIIGEEIMRLDRVVKTFLDFTRPAELKLADVAIDRFLADVVDLARLQAEAAGVRIETRLAAPDAVLQADTDMLRQAVLNVVFNAIEAMAGGGDLRIESSLDDGVTEIRISDTGCGIPPEKRDRVFQLYFTTKVQGSGIGLAMAYRIVELHGGKIDFTSEPGNGTTFVIRFP